MRCASRNALIECQRQRLDLVRNLSEAVWAVQERRLPHNVRYGFDSSYTVNASGRATISECSPVRWETDVCREGEQRSSSFLLSSLSLSLSRARYGSIFPGTFVYIECVPVLDPVQRERGRMDRFPMEFLSFSLGKQCGMRLHKTTILPRMIAPGPER